MRGGAGCVAAPLAHMSLFEGSASSLRAGSLLSFSRGANSASSSRASKASSIRVIACFSCLSLIGDRRSALLVGSPLRCLEFHGLHGSEPSLIGAHFLGSRIPAPSPGSGSRYRAGAHSASTSTCRFQERPRRGSSPTPATPPGESSPPLPLHPAGDPLGLARSPLGVPDASEGEASAYQRTD